MVFPPRREDVTIRGNHFSSQILLPFFFSLQRDLSLSLLPHVFLDLDHRGAPPRPDSNLHVRLFIPILQSGELAIIKTVAKAPHGSCGGQ